MRRYDEVQRHNYSHTGVCHRTNLSELKNMLANEEDMENPLSILTIKDEDKVFFIKIKAYQKQKWRKAQGQGDTKNINNNEVDNKISRQKALQPGICRSATIVETKDITPETASTRKLKVM